MASTNRILHAKDEELAVVELAAHKCILPRQKGSKRDNDVADHVDNMESIRCHAVEHVVPAEGESGEGSVRLQ